MNNSFVNIGSLSMLFVGGGMIGLWAVLYIPAKSKNNMPAMSVLRKIAYTGLILVTLFTLIISAYWYPTNVLGSLISALAGFLVIGLAAAFAGMALL